MRGGSSLETVPEVLVPMISAHLGGRELASLASSSRSCGSTLANEIQWSAAVRRRWFEPAWATRVSEASSEFSRRGGPAVLTPKMCGASTWARAYRELVRRGTSPRTWVTPRHGRVYMVGKGRAGQVAAWMTVAHSPDCRTVHRDELEPAAPRSIELRVLLQNAAAASVSFDPALIQVDWLCVSHAARLERRLPLGGLVRRGGDLTEVRKARVRASPAPHVLDGSSPDARSGLLHPLQWAVLVVHVECAECDFEFEFLERAVVLRVPCLERSATPPYRTVERSVAAQFETSDIHNWYTELPGGCCVLSRDI